MRKLVFISLAVVVAGAVIAMAAIKSYNPKPVAVQIVKIQAKPKPNKTVPPVSYHLGDTQNDGNLAITPTGAEDVPYAGFLPANTRIFQVDLTVTNNGQSTVDEHQGTGLTSLSSIYTQVGTYTSSGKYYLTDDSNAGAGCAGGGLVQIDPDQTVKTCVVFGIPTNVSVDTYFYDNLKWFL